MAVRKLKDIKTEGKRRELKKPRRIEDVEEEQQQAQQPQQTAPKVPRYEVKPVHALWDTLGIKNEQEQPAVQKPVSVPKVSPTPERQADNGGGYKTEQTTAEKKGLPAPTEKKESGLPAPDKDAPFMPLYETLQEAKPAEKPEQPAQPEAPTMPEMKSPATGEEPAAPTAPAEQPQETEAERQARKEQLKTEREKLNEERAELQAQVNAARFRPDFNAADMPAYYERLTELDTQIGELDAQIEELQRDVSAGKAIGKNIVAGLEGAGYAGAQALDWVAGENSLPWGVAKELLAMFTGKDFSGENPITAFKNQGAEEVAWWRQRAAEETAGNDTWEKVGQHTQSIAQSAPFIVLNLMSMGTAGGAGMTTELLQYASNLFQSSGMQGISAMAMQGMKALAENPSAQYAFMQTFGSSYDEALEDGASPTEATLYAVLNGAYNAMIEVGGADEALGGLQALPADVQKAIQSGDKNFVLKWLKTTGQEISEEEWQNFIAKGLKGMYQDVELYSEDNPDAIFNPNEMLDIAKNTAVDAGIMGGLQSGVQYGIDALANAAQNRQTPVTPTETETLAPDEALAQAATPTEAGGIPAPDTNAPVTPLMETLNEAQGVPAQEAAPIAEEAQEGAPIPPAAAEADTAPLNEFNQQEEAESQPATAQSAAESVLSGTGSTAKASDVEAGLQEIADYIQSNNDGQGIDEGELRGMAEDLAADIINNIPGEETGDRQLYDSIRSLLAGRGFQISDEIRGDVTDYDAWRRSLFGTIRMTLKGEPVDALYAELANEFGESLFPPSITAQADQINRIAEVMAGTRPQSTSWADNASQEDYDAALAEMTQKVLDEAGALPSTASAVSEENLASLEGEEPPVTHDGQPVTETGVEARGKAKERGFWKNVRESETTNPELAKSMGEHLETYRQLVSDDVLEAAQAIYDEGMDRSKSYLYDVIGQAKAGNKLPFEAIPLARMVANQMAADGDVAGAERLIADVAAELTDYGRLGNLGKLLRQGIKTPEGKLYGIQKTIDGINRSTNYDVALPQELIDKYNEQTTDEGRDAVIGEMQQAIADQMPAGWIEKFNALRYTAMLGNFKTQARNHAGNILSTLGYMAKNRIAAGIEFLQYALSGGTTERTKSFWAGSKLYGEAANDFQNVAGEVLGEGKYKDWQKQTAAEIDDKRTILKINGDWGTDKAKTAFGRSLPMKGLRKVGDAGMAALEGWRTLTDKAMNEWSDQFYGKINYAEAMGGWLAAHGIKSISDASAETLQKARDYAVKQAQEAIFRDDNMLSDAVSSMGRGKTDNKLSKAAQYAGEGIMPFRKTPANVAVRAEEFSPLGILNTFYKAWQEGNGKATSSEVIDQAAKALTGTGVMALGALLAAGGNLRGKNDDDKEGAFEKNQGAQDYSLVMPDGTSVTMEWATPYSIPLFMGVRLQEACADGGLSWGEAWDIINSVSDPMLELSMLDGINDFMEALQSAGSNTGSSDNKGSALADAIELAFANLIAQVVPTALGQAERMGEKYRQTTYTDPDSPLPKSIQKVLGKASAKIPGWDYHQQDYIDLWGRKQENKTGLAALWENFVSPWYTSADRSTPIDDELERLYGADYDKVLPEYASRSTKVDDVRISPEEYETYATERGQTALQLIQDFIESPEYKDLDDEQRAAIIQNLYKFADKHAKTSVMRQRGDETGYFQKDPVTVLLENGQNLEEAGKTILAIDSSGNGTIDQKELQAYFKEHPEAESFVAALWDAAGYTKGGEHKTWEMQKESTIPPAVKALTGAGMEQEKADEMFAAIDTNGNGKPTQKEIKAYYAEHPEDAEYLKALWESMGWTREWKP